jgi:serine/threonine protein kinase
MPAREEHVPTPAELRAYGLGKLDPQRASEVEAYLADHPECCAILEATPDDEVVRHLRGAGDLPAAGAPSPLLRLAVEGVIPVLGGCAGALVAGPEGGLAGVALGQVTEKAINFFGQRVARKWAEWFRGQPPATRAAALAELAELPPEEARRQVAAALEQLAPGASPEDREVAGDYLGAIPGSVRRTLLTDQASGRRTLPPTVSLDDPHALLRLLPTNVPPYPAPTALPGTDYRLERLIGTGGFGAVYRASSPSLQYLPLAIKFCLDRSLLPALHQERANLARLMKAGGEHWSPRIVRLYGYGLEHPTPYLVYEHVSGGDLVHWLAGHQARHGRGLTPGEVLPLIVQVTEALAFAHGRGLVHRDLKPANVLMDGEAIKLADFGIGGLVARRAVEVSRIGTAAASQLSPAEQASLFRGAGTPLYMSPEQKQGEAPDPRHDLYSLGVMWYQLLVGDVSREMAHGWARELEAKFDTPREQIDLIGRCVGWLEERPRDAGELLGALRPLVDKQVKAAAAEQPAVIPVQAPGAGPTSAPGPEGPHPLKSPPPSTQESERFRQLRFVARMRQLGARHQAIAEWRVVPVTLAVLLGVIVAPLGGWLLGSPVQDLLRYKLDWAYDTAEAGGWCTGVLGGLAILGGLVWLGMWLGRKALARAELKLAAMIDHLLTEFPLECATWGGRAVLADRVMVNVVLCELKVPQR